MTYNADTKVLKMSLYKRYIDVITIQKKDGKITPLFICWDNGKKYKIDRVLSVSRQFSKVGGCGLRYSCLVGGKQKNLFLEKDKWFIESVHP